MTGARRRVFIAAAWAALAAFCVAGLGGLATELGPWYRSLVQPAWKPPDWAFGPAWTLIFTLTAVAGARCWLASSAAAQQRHVLLAFAANGLLNVMWSVLFFKLQRPDWALAQVGVLWLSIAVLVQLARHRDPASVWLLLPYLLWVAFAASINAGVVQLNGPFVAAT